MAREIRKSPRDAADDHESVRLGSSRVSSPELERRLDQLRNWQTAGDQEPSPASEVAASIASGIASAPSTAPLVDLKLPDLSRTIASTMPRDLQAVVRSSDSLTGDSDERELEIVSPEDLGRLVRRARSVRNLSQQDFADLAGVGRRFVSELENGKATLELGKVLKVVRAAGFSLHARRN